MYMAVVAWRSLTIEELGFLKTSVLEDMLGISISGFESFRVFCPELALKLSAHILAGLQGCSPNRLLPVVMFTDIWLRLQVEYVHVVG